MPDPKLTYSLSTTPDPLQAGTQATLEITVSNPSGHHKVHCKEIDLSFVVGKKNAKDFCADTTGIVSSVTADGTPALKWGIEQSGGVFAATPATAKDGEFRGQSLTIRLSGIPVNDLPGTSQLTITETLKDGTTGSETKPLPKFPEGFKLGKFWADPGPVEYGGSKVVRWNGSSHASYQLQYFDPKSREPVTINKTKGESPRPLPAKGTYSVGPLHVSPYTVVRLVVTAKGVVGSEAPQLERDVEVTVRPKEPAIELAGEFHGDELWLKWNVEDADYCKLHDRNKDDLDYQPIYEGKQFTMKRKVIRPPLGRYYTLTAEAGEEKTTKTLELGWRREKWGVDTGSAPGDVAVSGDGESIFVTRFWKEDLLILNARTLEPDPRSPVETPNPEQVVVSPDGRKVCVVGSGQTKDTNPVTMLDAKNFKVLAKAQVLTTERVAFSPDGKHVFATNPYERVVTVLDSATLTQVSKIPAEDGAMAMAVSPDGRVFVLNSRPTGSGPAEDTISVFKAESLKMVGSPVKVENLGFAAVVSPVAGRLFVARDDNKITVLDTDTLEPVQGSPVTVPDPVGSMAMSPDGVSVILLDWNSALSVLDANNLSVTPVGELRPLEGPRQVTVSPDGTRVFVTTAGDDEDWGRGVSVFRRSTVEAVAD